MMSMSDGQRLEIYLANIRSNNFAYSPKKSNRCLNETAEERNPSTVPMSCYTHRNQENTHVDILKFADLYNPANTYPTIADPNTAPANPARKNASNTRRANVSLDLRSFTLCLGFAAGGRLKERSERCCVCCRWRGMSSPAVAGRAE